VEFGVMGGWRRDHTTQKIYESSFVQDRPAYRQSLLLSPIWEGRGFFSLFYGAWKLSGTAGYAPYSHQSGHIHDFDRTSSPVAQEASFTIRPSGYALGASGLMSYDWHISRCFHLLPVVGYVYDLLHIMRKQAEPQPFVFPNGAVDFFNPAIQAENDQMWGPFLGLDLEIEWTSRWTLHGGYAYQFLSYKSTYENHLHLVQTGTLDQNIAVFRNIKTSHAFANQGHLVITWKATPHFHVSILGEATYRSTKKKTKASRTTIVIDQSVPTNLQQVVARKDPVTAQWSTLNADLIFSWYF
jgi:hypothetical protein